MAKMDVLARIRKTGEERVYPDTVFENICDDPDNPLDFIKYVDIPHDSAPQPVQNQAASEHSQSMVDELLRLREENNQLKSLVDPEVKKSVGRPKKETA